MQNEVPFRNTLSAVCSNLGKALGCLPDVLVRTATNGPSDHEQ